jgi:hypothetical protein
LVWMQKVLPDGILLMENLLHYWQTEGNKKNQSLQKHCNLVAK